LIQWKFSLQIIAEKLCELFDTDNEAVFRDGIWELGNIYNENNSRTSVFLLKCTDSLTSKLINSPASIKIFLYDKPEGFSNIFELSDILYFRNNKLCLGNIATANQDSKGSIAINTTKKQRGRPNRTQYVLDEFYRRVATGTVCIDDSSHNNGWKEETKKLHSWFVEKYPLTSTGKPLSEKTIKLKLTEKLYIETISQKKSV